MTRKCSGHLTLLLISLNLFWPSSFRCRCSSAYGNYSLEVYSSSQCLHHGSQYNIYCYLRFDGSSNLSKPFEGWSIEWYLDGKRIQPGTTFVRKNRLKSAVTVHRLGLIVCLSRKKTTIFRRSLRVQESPQVVKKLLAKPIYTELNGIRVISASWKLYNITHTHSLLYRWHNDDPFLDEIDEWHFVNSSSGGLSCPGRTCTAVIPVNGNYFTNLSFYILTEAGKCKAKSPTWCYRNVMFVTNSQPHSTCFEIVFVPPTPSYLHITTSLRSVRLTWPSYNRDEILYTTFNCSPGSSGSDLSQIPQAILDLSDNTISGYQPYAKCVFCIRVSRYEKGKFSLPRCNVTRLHEEIPIAGPNITCTADTCRTLVHGDMRNMTLTWRLAPENTWNGKLTKVVVNSFSRPNLSQQLELPLTSFSLNGSVQIILNTSESYNIFMRACNRIGCSSQGNIIEVLAFSTIVDKKHSSYTIYIIFIVSGFVVGFVTTALCLVVFCLKQRKVGNSLPTIPLPDLEGVDKFAYYAAENKLEAFDKLETDQMKSEDDPNSNEVIQCKDVFTN